MSVTCSPSSRLASKKLTTDCGMCTSDRSGSAAFMRRLAGSWISSDDRCAASATITKEGTTKKCYPSPEYNMLPITWTVQPISVAQILPGLDAWVPRHRFFRKELGSDGRMDRRSELTYLTA